MGILLPYDDTEKHPYFGSATDKYFVTLALDLLDTALTDIPADMLRMIGSTGDHPIECISAHLSVAEKIQWYFAEFKEPITVWNLISGGTREVSCVAFNQYENSLKKGVFWEVWQFRKYEDGADVWERIRAGSL